MLKNDIVTERLILKNLDMTHAEDVYNIWNNEANGRYMCDPVTTLEKVQEIAGRNNRKEHNLVVGILKDSGEVIGTMCFGETKRSDQWGCGYSIKESHWGKGLASEMVKAMVDEGKKNGIKSILSACAVENGASGRVLEKNGFKITGQDSFRQPVLDVVYEENEYELVL